MSITSFLAAYGALLSSVGLGWSLYRDLHDRANLKVSVSVMRLAMGEDGKLYAVAQRLPLANRTKERYVVVTMTNVGRRPIMVKGWGGQWKTHPTYSDPHFVNIAFDLPKMLKEGEYHIEYTNDLRVLDENTKRLFAWDSTGKEWNVPDKELKKARMDVAVKQTDSDSIARPE